MSKLIDTVAAVQIDAESTLLHFPTSINCKIRVDPELILLCQKHGDKPHRGTRLGQMKDLWPSGSLKSHLLEQTKVFVEHMRLRGYDRTESETEMEVWGPFREKVNSTGLVNLEAGNPFFPDGRYAFNAGTSVKATKGPQMLRREEVLNSPDWKHGVVFLVRGKFLARYGKQDEESGVLIV